MGTPCTGLPGRWANPHTLPNQGNQCTGQKVTLKVASKEQLPTLLKMNPCHGISHHIKCPENLPNCSKIYQEILPEMAHPVAGAHDLPRPCLWGPWTSYKPLNIS